MDIVTTILVFVITWWMCFFVALPIGVRTQEEEGSTVHGSMGSAPAQPRLMLKAGIATLAAIILTFLIMGLIDSHWISLRPPVDISTGS